MAVSMILTVSHLSSPMEEDYRMPGQKQEEWAGKRWWWLDLWGWLQIELTNGLIDGVELTGQIENVERRASM